MNQQNKKRILIIGIGNVGIRHLESLLRSDLLVSVAAMDNSKNSLINAERIIQDNYSKNIKVELFNNIKDIKDVFFNLCIIATTSEKRIELIKSLVNKFEIKTFVIEKFLFQFMDDYETLDEIIFNHKLDVFVNCPRRMYDGYKMIKEKLNGYKFLNMSVSGYQWSMASNSIHFLDLFSFFTDTIEFEHEEKLIKNIIKNKRKGYYEVEGKMEFLSKNKNISLLLSNNTSKNSHFIISIETDKIIIRVDELANRLIITEKNDKVKKETYFKVPYQSDLSSVFTKDIFRSSTCDLIGYNNSKKLHMYLVNIFSSHFTTSLKSKVLICPIT